MPSVDLAVCFAKRAPLSLFVDPRTMAPSPDTCTLTALLRRAGLEHLLPRFVGEDLTIPLLVSMGTQLRANLADMALSADEIESVAAALRHQADPLHEAVHHGVDPSAKAAGSSGCCSDATSCCATSHQQGTVSPAASVTCGSSTRDGSAAGCPGSDCSVACCSGAACSAADCFVATSQCSACVPAGASQARQLLHEPASPVSSMSADPLASFRQAVAELQAELYADDLEPPAGAHAWSDEQLRTYYETGGESRPCWPPAPSLRGGSLTGGIAADLEPCPGGSRLSGRLEAEEAEAEEQPVVIRGDVVGTLHLKWQTHRADFDFAEDTTVGARDRSGCNPHPNP